MDKIEYANKLYELNGVEIFASGVHKGDKYTNQDLDAMIQAYNKVGFTPPLKDGHHNDEPGMPALGWIHNLRRVGQKLVADFKDMPKIVYDAIKNRRYDRVSSEIYFKFKNNGKVFDKVLKAVSLLGAEIPAVRSLRPLREQFQFFEFDFEFKAYEFDSLIYEGDYAYQDPNADKVYLDKLPDQAFGFIRSGGTKDDNGLTAPRDYRLFPHHEMDVGDGTDSETVNMKMLYRAIDSIKQCDLSTKELGSIRSHLRSHENYLSPKFSEEDEVHFWEDLEQNHGLKKELAEGRPKAVVGKIKGQTSTTIQTLIFPKPDYTVSSAKSWAKSHGFRGDKVDETTGSIRLRQKDPMEFMPNSFRTISLTQSDIATIKKGSKFSVGVLKDGEKAEIQSITFPGGKVEEYEEWLQDKGFLYELDHDINKDLMRFHQRNSDEFKEGSLRLITIPTGTSWDINEVISYYEKTINEEELQMEEKLKKIEEALAKLQEESKKELAEKEAENKKLSEQNTEMAKKVEELSKDSENLKSLQNEKKEIEDQKKKFSEIEEENKKWAEDSRKEKVEKKVGEVKIPAFRPHFYTLYDTATSEAAEKKVEFSADGKEKKEMSVMDVIDSLASTLNKLADKKVFGELSNGDIGNREERPASEDPKAEVDARVKKHMSEKGEKSYTTALKAVLDSDEELKKAYANS